MFKRAMMAAVAVCMCVGSLGCSPRYVSDAEDPTLDSYTMSLRFDRKDQERLYGKLAPELFSSAIAKQWERRAAMNDSPNVAIFPFRNETSEHIQVNSFASMFEEDLVNKSPVDVVSYERQGEMVGDTKFQMGAEYNPNEIADFGRQMGAQYALTGKVYDVAERVGNEKRVQYFLFVQVIEVETSAIKFQKQAKITKALVR